MENSVWCGAPDGSVNLLLRMDAFCCEWWHAGFGAAGHLNILLACMGDQIIFI